MPDEACSLFDMSAMPYTTLISQYCLANNCDFTNPFLSIIIPDRSFHVIVQALRYVKGNVPISVDTRSWDWLRLIYPARRSGDNVVVRNVLGELSKEDLGAKMYSRR